MLQVRLHGRGGQGVVTSAEVLAAAAFLDGRHAQAFPSFGSERTGAPVVAFCRVDDKPIRTREPIQKPDVVIIQDPTLLHQVPVFEGLRDGGTIIINTSHAPSALGLTELGASHRLLCVPATALARELIGRPLPGPALLGALAAVTGVVGRQALMAALRERVPPRFAEGNVAAAEAAYAREVARAGTA
jgi:pyruvate ferredoxin oxidoreductase gamma subunit